jgi:MoaA/NifB/PqqE/SkfB family radical SAM enzyme
VDAADYHRMMQVKPALFDRVLDNVRELLRRRGGADLPVVTVQFLADRENAARVLEMVDLARALRCDRVVVSPVQQVPFGRVGGDLLLGPPDAERLLPVFTELYRRDLAPCELEVNLAIQGLGPMLADARRAAGVAEPVPFATAPSFRDQDSGCFFAWYSTTITGNGDVYPCCQLIKPDGPVLGNVLEQGIAEVWEGERYETLRGEMREVLIEGADREHEASRFKVLEPVCHRYGQCWLKNMYFRGDDAFYAELRGVLEAKRAERARVRHLRGVSDAVARRLPAVAPLVDSAREASRPLRRWLKRRLGLRLTETG